MRLPGWVLGLSIAAAFFALIGIGNHFGQPSQLIASGQIELSEELTSYAKGIRTLYLTVFAAGEARPYGAIRYTLRENAKGSFHTFILTPDNLQIMGMDKTPPKSPIRIKARLDTTGQAGADKEGDLTGEVTGVPLAAQNLSIRIDKRVGI